MSASEHDVRPQSHRLPRPSVAPGPAQLSMSDLLASCAAATAVSTPPCHPATEDAAPAAKRRPARRADRL
ncbi:hypothetical protein ACFVYR_34300 [Streptomyces sp. NPDC058284]|uniref:hypothetical protein n=1 Tax=unclassified Streptomyces TaxID=2593676 RepID=UPI00364C2B95